MAADRENAKAGPDPIRAGSPLRSVPRRRGPSRAPEDRGAGRRAALSGARITVPRTARARSSGRGHCDPAGGTVHRLAGKRTTVTGEVRRRTVGSGRAIMDAGPAGAGGRWRWPGAWRIQTFGACVEYSDPPATVAGFAGRGEASLEAGTPGGCTLPGCGNRCPDVETGGHEVPRSGHRCLDIGTAGGRCPDIGTSVERCLDLGTAGGRRCLDIETPRRYQVPKYRYLVPRYRHRCLYLGTA